MKSGSQRGACFGLGFRTDWSKNQVLLWKSRFCFSQKRSGI